MKDIKFWVIVVLAVALGIAVWLISPNIPDGVGSYVLFLTLVAVLLYTRETHKLRIQSKRQIELAQEQMELSLKPQLEIVFQRAHFRLYNIGYGPATNIRIDPAIVHLPSMHPIRLKFACPPIVRKDEYQPIEIKIFWAKTDSPAVDLSPNIYTPPLGTETVKIRVHYENLNGKLYDRELVIGKEMSIDSNPVDFLLQYLYEKAPNGINAKEIPAHYVKPADLPKHLQYCMDKKLAEADRLADQERIEESRNLRITSDGIDYIERKG
jgi:hypothetical protein